MFRELIIEVLIVWVSFVSFIKVQELFISKWCSGYRLVLLVVYCNFLFALCLLEDMEVSPIYLLLFHHLSFVSIRSLSCLEWFFFLQLQLNYIFYRILLRKIWYLLWFSNSWILWICPYFLCIIDCASSYRKTALFNYFWRTISLWNESSLMICPHHK